MNETAPPDSHDADPDLIADALFEAETATTVRRPTSTYRLQLHAGFKLDDATAILDYLDDLGITDCYFSPFLDARPGSTHGYDVFDHGRINPEIGDDAAHDRLRARLADFGMGRVLDIVPNHMGVAGLNRFWTDLLETGPQAPSARFFDVDWEPIKEGLRGKVLLPILGDLYGKVLESGDLELLRAGGSFQVRCYDRRLPVEPRSYAGILALRDEEFAATFDPNDADALEYRSIAEASRALPPRTDLGGLALEHVRREKEVIKHRVARLCAESRRVRDFLDENVRRFRGTPGDPHSFDRLHALLDEQVYRLASWRVASEEINYRRFFDINELAGIRAEDPAVFEAIHVRIFEWVDQGGVSGLRIDHPDGMADPKGYFDRVQETLLLRACRARFASERLAGDWDAIADRIASRYREASAIAPHGPVGRRFPIVAEKILSGGESLPIDWRIDGTVGYEYLNALNGVFVDPAAEHLVRGTYAESTGDNKAFSDVLLDAKKFIADVSMASEVNVLARMLSRAAEDHRSTRDFTLDDLHTGLIDLIAHFPIYRTYRRSGSPPSPADRATLDESIERARLGDPKLDASIFGFIRDVLNGEAPAGLSSAARDRREAFIVRFQQTTGPVQAKGLEDTAFYRQVPLASLNEVGADPARFGTPPEAFHALNADRLARWPGGFSTTATHDTKRGEDARARLDALSLFPGEWRDQLAAWSARNAPKKVAAGVRPAPDAREEHLFYQAALGAWPLYDLEIEGDGPTPDGLVGRLQEYLVKAAREAKLNTSWTDPDGSYVDALRRFIADALAGPDSADFLREFRPFAAKIARVGVVHSLAQVVLKLASPGVADVYQGCELWDLSLVDPDNRRPVDYEARRTRLGSIKRRLERGESRLEIARSLLNSPADGAIKLYVTAAALAHRKAHPDLYRAGLYQPIKAGGNHADRVIGVARSLAGRSVLAIAPRLAADLMGPDARSMPVGRSAWGDTHFFLPDVATGRSYRDLLTDATVAPEVVAGRRRLDLAEVCSVLPLALLVDAD